mgnify:CR=1 FL=1
MNKCPICLNDYKNKKQLNRCSHTFCKNCITEWKKVNIRCPLCRKVIVNHEALCLSVQNGSNDESTQTSRRRRRRRRRAT